MHLFVFSFCLRRVGRGIAGLGIAGRCGFIASAAAAMPAAVIVRALFAALRSAVGRLSRRSLRAAALRMLTCRFITGLACAGLAVGLRLLALRLLGLCALLRTVLRALLCGVLRPRGGLRIGRLLPTVTAGAAARTLFLLALLGAHAIGLLVTVDIIRKQLRQRPRVFLRLLIAHRLRPILEQRRPPGITAISSA